METVIKLHKDNKQLAENPTIDISFADMLFDKNKRLATYAKYDKNYESTIEDEILMR
ncbi:hypothetical protein [Tissierella praeacuta]|uniref:hypothetical protein n=1 Tax=Tissierella praeacuta TaxID=43131 RepID=UPI0028AF6DB6|nr:hypothetical protein [Tissierella praeacuta]